MKLNNKKGFTLIELLAVIVILAILLAIAIPNVAKYINSARKSTFIENVQSYASAALKEAYAGNSYSLPINNKEAIAITFGALHDALEQGGKTSPYGGAWKANSYVIIANAGTAESPKFVYYIAAIDEKGYGIGANNDPVAKLNDELKENDIVQLGTTNDGISFEKAATDNGLCIRYTYETPNTAGTQVSYGTCTAATPTQP